MYAKAEEEHTKIFEEIATADDYNSSFNEI